MRVSFSLRWVRGLAAATWLPTAAAVAGGSVGALHTLEAQGVPSSVDPGSRSDHSTVVASGRGEARVAPDRATIALGVQTRATTAVAAAAQNARKSRAVLDALATLGLAKEQLSTTGYNVAPDMNYDQPTRTSHVVGYIVSNTVQVELKRIDQVASAIDAALGAGANLINSLTFSSSAAEETRRLALARAVAAARADAETMARAAGGTLGGLIELSTEALEPEPVFGGRLAGVAAASRSVPTPVEPGEQLLNASVIARWRFLPLSQTNSPGK
ncbi:MAG: hypothetical protein NVS4B3_01620 [Gemmatimonadaceae bacterium]